MSQSQPNKAEMIKAQLVLGELPRAAVETLTNASRARVRCGRVGSCRPVRALVEHLLPNENADDVPLVFVQHTHNVGDRLQIEIVSLRFVTGSKEPAFGG